MNYQARVKRLEERFGIGGRPCPKTCGAGRLFLLSCCLTHKIVEIRALAWRRNETNLASCIYPSLSALVRGSQSGVIVVAKDGQRVDAGEQGKCGEIARIDYRPDRPERARCRERRLDTFGNRESRSDCFIRPKPNYSARLPMTGEE